MSEPTNIAKEQEVGREDGSKAIDVHVTIHTSYWKRLLKLRPHNLGRQMMDEGRQILEVVADRSSCI